MLQSRDMSTLRIGAFRLSRKHHIHTVGPRLAPLAMLGLLLLACGQGGDGDGAGTEALAESSPRLRCDGCNVVLISIDTLRADHLATYGYDRVTSPEIDRFAEDALVFDRAYSQAPTTLPSHMSIFTSLYPSHHGVFGNTAKLPDTTVTMADVFHDAGYKTAAFTGGGYVRDKFGYHTFDHFQVKEYFDIYEAEFRQVDAMLQWLDNRAPEAPFFLFWHTYKVHSPYSPEPEFDLFSAADYDGIVNSDPEERTPVCAGIEKPRQCNWKGKPYYDILVEQMGPEDIQHVVDKYDGEIIAVDEMFTRLMAKLEAEGVTDDTVIIFLSDHGENFAEREKTRFIGHGVLYEEVLHVPLMIKIPGGATGRIPQIVELVDVMPTVLGIVGLDVPDGLDGQNLFRKARQAMGRYPARSEFPPRGLESVRVPGFSMIRTTLETGVTTELYDLEQDPRQRENLADGRHAMLEALTKLLVSETGGRRLEGEEIVLDEELVKDLQSLGYL